jgi:hypothetical protein
VEQQDVERIARAALKELGVTAASLTVTHTHGTPGVYHVDFGGARALKVKCGPGSSAQWIRDQIFEQYQAQ